MTNFTPQEIEQFLQEFFDVVGTRQYTGARYVPIFGRKGESSIEWDKSAPYEPLTVVMYQGVSYVSKQYVPKDIEINDTNYWAETYRFNAQVEQYRQEVLDFDDRIEDNTTNISTLNEQVNTMESNIETMNTDFSGDIQALNNLINSLIIDSGTSDAETIAARTNIKNSRTYTTLGARLLTESWSYIRDISSADDMNNITALGFYYVGDGISNISNFPIVTSEIGFVIVFGKSVINTENTNTPAQLYVSCRDVPQFYMRQSSGSPAVWSEWKRITNDVMFLGNTNQTAYDANDLLKSGYWFINNSDNPSSYTNYPCETGVLFVLPQVGGSQCYQVVFDATSFDVKFRRRAGATPTWGSWISVKSRTIDYLYKGATHDAASNNSYDADNLLETGYWWVNHATDDQTLYSNYVSNTGILIVVNNPTNIQCYQITYDVTTQNIYFRRRGGSPAAWSMWYPINKDTVFTPILPDKLGTLNSIPTINTPISGTVLKLMTYNVCQYDNDTTIDMSEEQLFNLRSMIAESDCDIMGWQESTDTINDNGANDKYAIDWVFNGMFPFNYINRNESLHCKLAQLQNPTNVSLTQGGRHYSHATVTIDSKNISIYSVHPYPGATPEAVSIRENNLLEFASILANDSADYIIAFGDYNIREGEMTRFNEIFSNFNMVNGGYLGWYATTGRYKAAYGAEFPNDNIILSKNIVIRKIHLYKDWYSLLYSDHLPLIAEVVLLES